MGRGAAQWPPTVILKIQHARSFLAPTMPARDVPTRSSTCCACISVTRVVGATFAVVAVCLLRWSLISENSSTLGPDGGMVHGPNGKGALPGVPRGSARRKLPVLIIQMDDRPISSTLDNSTSFVSLSVAINYNYALRHGYDYRFATVFNDEAHKANVSVSPTAMYTSIKELESHGVNLKGCFHPILGTQRAAPWCKVLVAWLAAHETAYDYVVFLDADA